MLSFLRDTAQTWQTRARYKRLVQQRLLELAESTSVAPDTDESQWRPLGGTALTSAGAYPLSTHDVRERARELVARHPYAANLLRLLEIYVAGPGLKVTHRPVRRAPETPGDVDAELANRCDDLWRQCVATNARHWSFREHARRVWRDGEAFVRKFAAASETIDQELIDSTSSAWPPRVRFVEPAQIAATADDPESDGVLTQPGDIESPIAYVRQYITAAQQRRTERIPAEVMHHARCGADSNERRGRSVFAPVLQTLDVYDKWLDTELRARRLQASIVLWRKVHGSPQVDGEAGADGVKRETVRPGTIVTTSPGTELEFLQPKTNFGDAVGLGRQLLLAIAAGVGVPEYMLTADASNANFASTMVAEGPAVKLFQSLQQWLADDLTRFWRWIMQDAVDAALLPRDTFDRIHVEWTFPTLVARDRPAERMADVALLDHGVLSRAEVARRDGVDPEQMEREQDPSRTGPAVSGSSHDD